MPETVKWTKISTYKRLWCIYNLHGSSRVEMLVLKVNKITNFHFNDTKYNFVTRNQIIIDSTKLRGGYA